MRIGLSLLALAVAILLAGGAAKASKLEDVQKRGVLNCGVYPSFSGFSSLNADGKYVGFDIDFCDAVGAAVNVAVKHLPHSSSERFPAVQSGTVDLLSMVTTWTAGRDTGLGLQFTVPTFYDGQAFMVRVESGIKSANQLNGATICVQQGTTGELNLADWFRSNNYTLNAIAFTAEDDVIRAYEAKRCDATTGSRGIMAGRRLNLAKPDDHLILPEVISKEPLTPVTAEGDDEWTDIVRWAIWATMIAEEKGITKANVKQVVAESTDPEVQRLLGKTGSLAKGLGLDDDWAVRIISKVGNYGEIFERNLGKSSPLGLDRGLNNQWNKGGLLYAPPFR